MAEPLDSVTILEDVDGVIMQDYMPSFERQYSDVDEAETNALFSPSSELIGGDGQTMIVELAPSDSTRFNTDPLGDFAQPDSFEEGTVKFRFSSANPANSDFSEVSTSAQVDDITLANGSRGTIVDVADYVYRQLVPGYARSVAMHRHLGRSSRLALVNGTPKQDNSQTFALAAASPTNATGLRVPIDAGAIAYMIPGMRLDFYSAAGVIHAGKCRIDYVNYADKSIGVVFNTTGLPARISTGDLSTVADNDEIFFSGERNKGMYSFGAYNERPTAGESFIGGKDRTVKGSRFLNVLATRENETDRQIRLSDFDDFANASGFQKKKEITAVWMTDPEMTTALRNIIGEAAFFQIPIDDTRAKRYANFGSLGLNYQHPSFGNVKIMSSKFAVPNTIRVLIPETWIALNYGWKGLKFMPGTITKNWSRLPNANGTGFTKIYKCEAYALIGDWCKRPGENGEILHVTAA